MNRQQLSYKNLCRQLFIHRYRERLQRYTPPPYGLPCNGNASLDTLLPYLLNDKEFYQGRVYASNSRLSLGSILWEALGMSPDEYMALCDMIVNPKGPFSRTYAEHPVGSVPVTYSTEQMHLMSLDDFFLSLKTWPQICMNMCFRDILDSLYRCQLWLYQNNFGDIWKERPCHRNMIRPLEYGLMIYIEDEWRRLAWVYLDSALSATPNAISSTRFESEILHRIQNDKVFDDDEEKGQHRSVQVLFSAAGTGKTHQIFQLLQNHWGFYIMAPNLLPGQEKSKTADIVEPQRYSASKDTLTMFQDHPQVDPRWPSGDVEVSRAIIVARCALLYEFLNKYPEETPTKWLWLQIFCQRSDPFDALYRLFRLSSSTLLWCDSAVEIHAEMPGYMVPDCYALLEDLPSKYFNGSLYHCFDEAQVALDDALASSMFTDLYSDLTLHDMMSSDWTPRKLKTMWKQKEACESHQTSRSWINNGMPYIHPTLVISGTSLRLRELEEKLTGISTHIWDTDPNRRWEEPRFHTEFPVVASDQDFWKLYEEHTMGVLSEHENARVMMQDTHTLDLPLMSRSGRPLALGMSSTMESDNMSNLLRKPLSILPWTDIFRLLGQTYKFILASDHTRAKGGKDFHSLELEELLDRHTSEEVSIILALNFTKPFLQKRMPDGSALGQSILRLLLDHGSFHLDELLEAIQHEAAQPLSSDFIFAESSKVLHNALSSLYIRRLITSHSLGQRGRYRWSTIYIEEIIQLFTLLASKGYSLADIRSSIKKAKTNSTTTAVEALKSQVRKIKAAHKGELAQDLFRAAIRAEMMSTPTIFLKKEHADLVTYGFALVQRDGETMRYTLSEPIAVYAVMEYLRTEGGEEYQELMLQWLINTQDDYEVRSMFGKATEWFVAMSFDRMLRYQSLDGTALVDLLDGVKRRETLLERFGKATRLDTQTNQSIKLGAGTNISDFALPEVSSVFEYRTPSTIWNWMRQFRLKGSGSTPTFMFPDINAGPDLIFVLEKQATVLVSDVHLHSTNPPFQGSERVFIAVQVKTGQNARFEDAMESLVESNWHKNIQSAARDTDMQEVEYWQDIPFILVLICTGITVKQAKIDRWIKTNAPRIPQGRLVCVLDETVTGDIWGQDFVTLVDTIRTQNTQKQRPWEQDVRDRGKIYTEGVVWGDRLDQSRKRRHLDV